VAADQRGLNRQERRRAQREARRHGRAGGGVGGPDAALRRAVAAHAEGRTRDAEAGYRRVLEDEPDHAGALRLLGLLLDHRAELTEAINGLAAESPAPRRRGDDDHHAAVALVALERRADAEQRLRRALDADPAHAPALVLLSSLRREAGHVDEAAALARRAVTASDSAEAHRQLGLALGQQDRVVEAVAALRRAVELAPADAEAWNSLGHLLLEVGELQDAFEAFSRARDLEPGAASLHNNVAVAAQRMGRYEIALQASKRAIQLDPGNAQYRYNRAFSLLGSGDLRRGWEDFEHGFAIGARTPVRDFPVPRWDGAPRPDATLLIWREQGVGDEIRFASCYADAAARVGRLVIESDRRLVPLLARSFPAATVRAQGTGPATPDFDLHIPAGSLPRFLRRSLDDFPEHDGYLTVDPRQAARFRERLDALGPGLKVGISWRSMNLGVQRLSHYTVLEEWAPVFAVPGLVFVNLQYGVPEQVEAELEALREQRGTVVHRWDDVDYTDDFDAVAGLISQLDVVVGVGTTPALLAGALGTPTLMLALPDPMAFGQERFPWMPSLRRFPRSWDESWEGPMERIAAELRARVGSRVG